MEQTRDIFITGGTGYVGRRLAEALAARGHHVRVLARAASMSRVPQGCDGLVGNALDADSYAGALKTSDTLVHLVGTPHPSPSKAAQFEQVDRPSIEAAVAAAMRARISHLIYVSVAHPAPVMHAYVSVRMAGERLIAAAGLTSTILRPWYVLGPGHRWPIVLMPIYFVLGLLPLTRDGAKRLGLVTIEQMVQALTYAVENPPTAGRVRVLSVPDIRHSLGRV